MKNRWGIVLSAVGIHASLGIIYAWSVFKAPFMDEFGWSEFQAGIPFGLSIFCLGISAAMMGPTLGVSATFAVLAIICAVVMLFSALYLEVPANDGKFLQTELKMGKQPKNKLRNGLFPMMANEAVKTWSFYGLWLMMFINILCGIRIN